MNTLLQNQLTARHAQFSGARIDTFGTPANDLFSADALQAVPLTHWAIARVTGEDATSFLQNLLTNDARKLSPTRAALNGFCTPKGRMLASFLMWREGEDYLLALSADIAPGILKKLAMYVLRSKVKIIDESDRLLAIGLTGTRATQYLAEQGWLPEAAPYSVAHAADATVIDVPHCRYLLVVPAESADMRLDALTEAGFALSPANVWDACDIAAGIPFITAATQEAFVPQMVNFELIGGVNFQKGCYPGQEIVARTQYLGKLKKRMYRARILGQTPTPTPGDHLFGADLQDQSCGQVVTCARNAEGGSDVLAVIQTSSVDAGPVHLGSSAGAVLQLLSLPYELT